MIEVHKNLYVGNQLDYEKHVKGKDWCVVHCCKEPYHREALGYKGMGAPRDHPDFLFKHQQDDQCRRLILNMVDAPKPEFFPLPMIDEALKFIGACRALDQKVLVHCNQGHSRSPSLALKRDTDEFDGMSFEEAEDVFRSRYRPYDPAAGIRAFVKQQWGVE